jgi:polyphosphate glucokinase
MELLGIDIGGSGIKAAMVDADKGAIIGERHRMATPDPSHPSAIVEVVLHMLQHFDWHGPTGVCLPTVVADGKALTCSNLSREWRDFPIQDYLEKQCGQKFFALNDADAAGLAEMQFGAGVGKKGLAIVVTIGTGLGSGVFYNGQLIPNIELGRVFGKDGEPIEFYAADSARKREGLSYREWGERFDFFLNHIVRVFSPDLFIIGGGAGKKLDKFKDRLTIDVPLVPAEKRNDAGIIGAAMFAAGRL